MFHTELELFSKTRFISFDSSACLFDGAALPCPVPDFQLAGDGHGFV